MKINSHNEWDALKEIIVGRAEGQACLNFAKPGIPKESVVQKAQELAQEAYPEWLVQEVSEDLEGLCDVLRNFGAKVHRPDTFPAGKIFVTPFFAGACDHVYNMRDLYLVVGNNVIESPSQERHRYFEATGLYGVLYHYFKESGFRWIAGPKPVLKGEHMQVYYEGGRNRYEDGQKYIKLTEDEVLFEAANTARMGRDLLYLVSRSGNNLGAQWLQSVLGNEYRVHTTDKIYKSSHIDSTVLCLRPGLVLLNAERVNENICPPILAKWEKIYFSDIMPIPKETLEFHEKVRMPVHKRLLELGIESNIDSVSSKWIGMNILSLDRQTVVVDKRQTKLIETLQKRRLSVIPISFRHSYFMGGIHCSTLDTVRGSELESYCD